MSERGKFPKGRGATCTQRVSFLVGVKMRLNEHYCTFPIDSGNQTDKNVPSVERNVRFFDVCYIISVSLPTAYNKRQS